MAKDYIKAIDGMNLILKVILFFFIGNILGGIYRICKGKLIFGVIWFFLPVLGGVLDIVGILLDGKPKFFV